MNLFEAVRHDLAKILRDAADTIYPVKPMMELDLEAWPRTVVNGLIEFCADEDVNGEVGLAMLAASSLQHRAVKHAAMEEELHNMIDEGGIDNV